ncbi:hypothetical protein H1D32_13260 [Anaerobacillus sp. CMMVII]|uniref:hypothetical protein n=1 Tax=Anaerobacillus sp. CMMVII TaxID=2755588 RepID=UPI0021B7A817|nr:hypothetical protein [Anaerobacillus sp. CMMVII]MCT8138624.1 hypothetical protein [Anaerobacillus sp. CMMVII]
MKMQVTLSPKEVEQIVKEHLFTKFKTVGEVKLEIGKQSRGYGYAEETVTVFKGATCEVEI